jgi:hypothetical protein
VLVAPPGRETWARGAGGLHAGAPEPPTEADAEAKALT